MQLENIKQVGKYNTKQDFAVLQMLDNKYNTFRTPYVQFYLSLNFENDAFVSFTQILCLQESSL